MLFLGQSWLDYVTDTVQLFFLIVLLSRSQFQTIVVVISCITKILFVKKVMAPLWYLQSMQILVDSSLFGGKNQMVLTSSLAMGNKRIKVQEKKTQ